MLLATVFQDLGKLSWLALPLAYVVFVVAKAGFDQAAEARERRMRGCGKIASKPQWDYVWGLDVAVSQFRSLKNQTWITWLRDMHKGMPKTFKVKHLGNRQIFTSDPENLKYMLSINWKDFAVAPLRRYNNLTHPFAERGPNTTDGEEWVFSRFLLKPFFYREVYIDIARIQRHTDEMLEVLPPDGETFNMQPLLQRWFLDANTQFIFGEPMGALRHPERAKISWAMLDVLRGARMRLQMYKIFHWLNWDWWHEAIAVVHGYVDVHLAKVWSDIEARKKVVAAGQDPGPERTDLLWYMANNCPDKDELRSQLSLLFVPNNDTVSIFTSHVIWNVARHPEVWAKLRAEVREHGDKPITFESLRQMKYVQAVLNETHRIQPNNLTQVRICAKDTTLPRGGGADESKPIFIRKGDMVQATKPVLHRDPEIWGDDAEIFRPERFVDRAYLWEFVPFSGGPRRCPAQMMVTTDVAYIVVRLAQTYARIEARDENPYTPVVRVGPSNKTGVKIALYRDG